jgi:hypothetical protein
MYALVLGGSLLNMAGPDFPCNIAINPSVPNMQPFIWKNTLFNEENKHALIKAEVSSRSFRDEIWRDPETPTK